MNRLYKNTAFWAWNGRIEKGEALRQLADFKDKGYGGAFIHARGGLEIEYMGDAWFDVFDACVAWAKTHGFDIWIYDEYGWPSGFGGGKVNGLGDEYRLKRLECLYAPVTQEGYTLIGKYTVNEKTAYVYFVVDKNYVDLLNPKVTQAFIESTHEVYYRRYADEFGKVIRGIFTDEPQISTSYAYSPCMERAFLDKYGVSFHKELWKLFDDNGEREDFFYKYHTVTAELLTENFTKPLSKWCKAHGVLFTGHFAEEDGLTHQYRVGGGVMANYQPMQQPGIDFLGRRLASPVLPRQLSSVKNQFGKETVISETFGCCGWNTSFAELAWIWGYQAAHAVNKACLHLSSYTLCGNRKRDYPAFFSYQEPWWDCFKALSEEMEDSNAFVSQGKSVADILLISPLTSVYFQPYGAERGRVISAQFRMTVEHLTKKQYPFDIGDERLLAEYASVTPTGKLRVGQAEYAYVLVAEADNLEKSTSDLLQAFQKLGGKLAFINKKPEKRAGERLETPFTDCYTLANRAGLIEKYFNAAGYVRKAAFKERYDGEMIDGLVTYVSETQDELFVFAQNVSKANNVEGRVSFAETGQIYDGTQPLDTHSGEKGVYADVTIPPMGRLKITLKKRMPPQSVEKRFVSANALTPIGAKLLNDNAFTIDKAYYVVDGECSPLTDTAVLQDEINKTVLGKGRASVCVCVCYSYRQNDLLPCLKIAAETQGTKAVRLNGTDITARFADWYVDKNVRLADVTDLQKTGDNLIEIEYVVVGERAYTDTLDGFETERNVFHYKTEAESVYLLGDFSVFAEGAIQDDGYITADISTPTLVKSQTVDFGKDLTAQGLYFYRGCVEYRYRLHKEQAETVRLTFQDFHAPTAKIVSNGKERVVINPRAATDITDMLEVGDNELSLVLYSSNRNLLGPFHHRSGEPAFVGGNTYRGVKGFEDGILYAHFDDNTYDKRYHFVKFGLGATIALKYTDK
ncbi:MAG: hypothetical protein IJ329_02025 [Clostridia bacterium]|nr:hypothetical protein [Clostridia bacterium]